jgi:hypothetical protein
MVAVETVTILFILMIHANRGIIAPWKLKRRKLALKPYINPAPLPIG